MENNNNDRNADSSENSQPQDGSSNMQASTSTPSSHSAQLAHLNAALATVLARRDAYRAYLLSWYDDAYTVISSFQPQAADAYHHATITMALRRPLPNNTTTTPRFHDAAGRRLAISGTLGRDNTCPAHVCATILPEIAHFRDDEDSDVRSRGNLVGWVLEHLAVFDTDDRREWSGGTVGENLERVYECVRGGVVQRLDDVRVVWLAVELVEQLDALERRAARFLRETQENDMTAGAREALRLLGELLHAVKMLPGAARRVGSEGSIVLPGDWIDPVDPAAMMVWRAAVRGARGRSAWIGQANARRTRRELWLEVAQLANERLRNGIMRSLAITVSDGFLKRARRMRRAFDANKFCGPVFDALNNAIKEHAFMHDQRELFDSICEVHMARDLGRDGSNDLHEIFTRSMQGIEAQMADFEAYVEGLSFMQRRAVRTAAERHDFEAVVELLGRYRPDSNFSHETTRRQMLHHLGVCFLWSKAATIRQHLSQDNDFRISASFHEYEDVHLVRLFCYGAHYFRASQKDRHDMGCLITGLSWMCGLIESWMSNVQELKKFSMTAGAKVREQSRLVGEAASQEALDVVHGELHEAKARLKRQWRVVNNLMDATDVFVGTPPSVDPSMDEPIFDKFTRNEDDHSVIARYAEVRRFVLMPRNRGVLQGGTIEIVAENVKRWA
ncbi:hypothetical protein BFW01_g532 [Lasiodiplodia theobromae]|nr:hypothetical protein BFW01_g532 [Lasiodiplodia theobromae]